MDLSATFAISERACAKLKHFLLPENELIPLRRELDGYYALNPLLTADGEHLLRMMLYQFPSAGPILGVLVPDAVTSQKVFKISNTPGLFAPAEFRDAYLAAGLTGLLFTQTAIPESYVSPDLAWQNEILALAEKERQKSKRRKSGGNANEDQDR